MPGHPRRDVVDPTEVAVYHCWNRCVRGTFLCGYDQMTQQNHEHRRQWIHDFEQRLAGLFAVEIGFHATLHNHIHLVLRSRPDIAARWKDEDVVRRWLLIAKMKRTGKADVQDPSTTKVASEMAKPGRVDTLRRRLSHISWLMGTLCENISRRINREEQTTGTCWEDRFACRKLVDEASLLICGIYVDLNVIRAGLAATPEESQYTSAYDRIQVYQQQRAGIQSGDRADGWLCELTLDEEKSFQAAENTTSATSRRASDKGLLPLTLEDYLNLLDWTGKQLRADKAGAIPSKLAPILDRLKINTGFWVGAVSHFENWFGSFVGEVSRVTAAATRVERRWFRGQAQCANVFG